MVDICIKIIYKLSSGGKLLCNSLKGCDRERYIHELLCLHDKVGESIKVRNAHTCSVQEFLKDCNVLN